jgi:ABC-type nitrate/sulfonate/bicarbonate transport system permease component
MSTARLSDAVAAPAARPARCWVAPRALVIRSLSLLATLVIWEWYGRGVDPIFLSYPSAIAAAIPGMIETGELPRAFLASISGLAIGLAFSIVFGVLLGLLMGRFRTIDYLLDVQISALYATPTVGLLPLLILWFGLGTLAQVILIFLAAFFPIIVNTHAGVRNVSQGLVEVVKVEAASEFQIFMKVIVPASLPFIMTGVRLAMGRAVVGMVVGEYFTSVEGLGGAIVNYGNSFATAKLFVILIVLALLGIVLTETVRFAERWAAPWKETERAT